jgi:hypothetical protein
MGLPPSRSIAHMIDLIYGTSLPKAPSYRLTPREASEIECQIHQLLESSHIQPSLSPCAPPTFIIPKKENFVWCLMTNYRALNNTTVRGFVRPLTRGLFLHKDGFDIRLPSSSHA